MRHFQLFLALVISITFFSCKKESSDTPDASHRVKMYKEDYTSGSTHIVDSFNLNYDKDGRIISMVLASSQGSRFEYAYTNSGATMDMFEANALSIHEVYFLNSNSQLDSTFQYNNTQDTTTEKYIYNGNKQLIKLIEYIYSNAGPDVDNITNFTYDASGNVIKAVDDYTQTSYDYYTDLSYDLTLGLPFLHRSKNLVKTTTVSDGSGTEVLTHTYTFDASKRLSTEAIIANTGEILIKTYTY